jgi:hypothetical protein
MSPYPLSDLGNILYDSTGLPSVAFYVSQCVWQRKHLVICYNDDLTDGS